MLAIKNGHVSLYCHFNKIIKGSGTNFQSPVLSQKHVRNIYLTAYQYLTKFPSQISQDSKEISISENSTTINAYDDMKNFKICRFHINIKIQISRERNLFFLQIKKKTQILLNDAPRSNQLHPHLLHPSFCNTLNIIRTKILQVTE